MAKPEELHRIDNCQGQLSLNGMKWEITFDLVYGVKGSIALLCRPMEVNNHTFEIYRRFTSHESTVAQYHLLAAGKEWESITSNSVYLKSCSTPSDENGTRIEISASALQIDLERPTSFQTSLNSNVIAHAQFLTQGQRACGLVQCLSPLGTVSISGEHDPKDYHRMTAALRFESSTIPASQINSWASECQSYADSLLDVLSMADGRLIRWGVMQVFANDLCCRLCLVALGSTDPPYHPVFSHLNLLPALRLAIEKYSKSLRDRTGIVIALRWALIQSRYSEVRFIAKMTALEHLISMHASSGQQAVLPSGKLRKDLISSLEQTLAESIGNMAQRGDLKAHEAEEVLRHAKSKLQSIMDKSLKSKLLQMLEDYGVPLDGIDQRISGIVKTRNHVAHRGFHEHGQEHTNSLSSNEAALGELLVRIFLSLMEYSGKYDSWLHGNEYKEFVARHAPILPSSPSIAEPTNPKPE